MTDKFVIDSVLSLFFSSFNQSQILGMQNALNIITNFLSYHFQNKNGGAMNFSKIKIRITTVLFAVLLSTFLVGNITAQTGSSSVTGSVTDEQNRAVAGATVRLLNEGKGFSRTVVTTNEGTFNFQGVPPDTYSVEVELTGFKKFVQTNVNALVDKTTEINVLLEVGNVTEVVTVTGNTLESIVNTQDASLGNNFVSKQILELPLEGRNVGDLLSLQPGVTATGEVTGSRSDQANITLDGVDVNDQQNGTAFTPVLRVSTLAANLLAALESRLTAM